MTIPPDAKDWTWVLDRPCPQCGFDARHVGDSDIAPAVRSNAASWPARLARADVRTRPHAERWSILEYACHVRDVFRLFSQRLDLMLAQDNPTFVNWDQDATAIAARYDRQDPAAVGAELVVAAEDLATTFDSVRGDQWSRSGTRSNGSPFTVSTLGAYLVHDAVHHLWDVDSDIGSPGSSTGHVPAVPYSDQEAHSGQDQTTRGRAAESSS